MKATMPRRHSHQKHTPFSFQETCQEKRRFANEHDAQESAESLMAENIGLQLHIYQCPRCHGWHLTRQKLSL